jgi:hypothetical protein
VTVQGAINLIIQSKNRLLSHAQPLHVKIYLNHAKWPKKVLQNEIYYLAHIITGIYVPEFTRLSEMCTGLKSMCSFLSVRFVRNTFLLYKYLLIMSVDSYLCLHVEFIFSILTFPERNFMKIHLTGFKFYMRKDGQKNKETCMTKVISSVLQLFVMHALK